MRDAHCIPLFASTEEIGPDRYKKRGMKADDIFTGNRNKY